MQSNYGNFGAGRTTGPYSTQNTSGTNWSGAASSIGAAGPCDHLPKGPDKQRCKRDVRRGLTPTTGTGTTQGISGQRERSAGALGTTPVAGSAAQYQPPAQARSQADLNREATTARMTAPSGSMAAGLGEVTGLPLAANNPYLLTSQYLNQQYGLPYGSASSQLAMEHLGNTPARIQAILGEIPGNYIDMVNFGASLLETSGVGAQLDPMQMLQTISNGIQSADPNDPNSVGTASFSAIKSAPPAEGIKMLISLVGGALAGTMPDDALANFLTSLEQYAMSSTVIGPNGMMGQSLGEFSAGEEAGGWFGQLMNVLGPTLGL